LAKLSGNAVKLYLELLLAAEFAGPNKGRVAATFAELATRLKMHRTTIYRAATKLRPRYITWEGAKNQLDTTIFTIQKYKSVEDFACSRRTVSGGTACERQGNGVPLAQSATDSVERDLKLSNKLNKPEKLEKQQLCELWNLTGVSPRHRKIPPPFRELCEALYVTRNGQSMGEFVGVCMDVWESQGNKIPAPFARAAKRIREHNPERACELSRVAMGPHRPEVLL
jgi:hypothetical protein